MRALILARNEALKARSRVAFWVALAIFSGLMGLIFGGMHFSKPKDPKQAFMLPGGWAEIIGGPGVMACFFAAIVLILLVSSEFSWKTARQNVIDGLSKNEFFSAKLMLVPVLGLLYFVVLLAIGGGFALAGTNAAAGPIVRDVDAAFMGGALLGLFGWAALAFFLAMTVRNSGPAIGAFFLYFLVEQILGQLVTRLAPASIMVTRYLPVAVFKQLWQASQFGVSSGATPSLALTSTRSLIMAGSAYVFILIAASFAIYRKRDL